MSEQPPALDALTMISVVLDVLHAAHHGPGSATMLDLAEEITRAVLAAQAEQQAATPPDVRGAMERAFSGDEFEENAASAAREGEWSWFKWLALTTLDQAAGVLASTPRPEAAVIDADHLARQREWSERTFGPGTRLLGVLDHIRKELREIEADPTDVTEWIDVVILALDGAWRAGWEPQQIIDAIKAKQARNESRTWPDWREASPDHAIEHVREDAPRPEGETRVEWGVRYRLKGHGWDVQECADEATARAIAADTTGMSIASRGMLMTRRVPVAEPEWTPVEQDGDDR